MSSKYMVNFVNCHFIIDIVDKNSHKY